MVDSVQIKQLINSVLCGIKMYSNEAELIVYETGKVESQYKYISQLGNGHARSFWQIEPSTGVDNIDSWLIFRDHRLKDICSVCFLEPNFVANIRESDMDWLLRTNLAFAICMCRIKYWRVDAPIPKTLEGRALYWKDFYNADGKGTVKRYMEVNSA